MIRWIHDGGVKNIPPFFFASLVNEWVSCSDNSENGGGAGVPGGGAGVPEHDVVVGVPGGGGGVVVIVDVVIVSYVL